MMCPDILCLTPMFKSAIGLNSDKKACMGKDAAWWIARDKCVDLTQLMEVAGIPWTPEIVADSQLSYVATQRLFKDYMNIIGTIIEKQDMTVVPSVLWRGQRVYLIDE